MAAGAVPAVILTGGLTVAVERANRPREAVATPTSPTTYTVTYPGSCAMDANVGYDYLRRLSRLGYTVRVGGVAFTPAHVIAADR